MFERKFFAERVRRFTDQLENTLYDAYQRSTEERDARGLPQATADEINVYSWPQTWPDARHGFPNALPGANEGDAWKGLGGDIAGR